jgi:hypothetical protein
MVDKPKLTNITQDSPVFDQGYPGNLKRQNVHFRDSSSHTHAAQQGWRVLVDPLGIVYLNNGQNVISHAFRG